MEEALFNIDAIMLPWQFLDLYQSLKSREKNIASEMVETYKNKIETFLKIIIIKLIKSSSAMFRLYYGNVNKDLQPEFIKKSSQVIRG